MSQEKINKGKNYIEVKNSLNWDEYFMLQALMASFKSKDPNTKVGCVFVDAHNHQISMGYNGFIAGFNELEFPWGNSTEVPLSQQKYGYVVHSEANAILHAKGSLQGSRVYVTLFPCHECAKMITTVGVKEIIYLSDKYQGSDGNNIAKKIFQHASITYRQLILDQNLVTNVCQYLAKETNIENDRG